MLALAGLARRKRARGTPQREIRPRGTPAQTTPYCIPTRPGAAGPHKVSIRDMGGGRRRAPAGASAPARRRPRICQVERFRTASFSRPAVLRGPLSEIATFACLHLPSGAFSNSRAFANWGFVGPCVQNRYVRGSETSGLTCARTVFDATGRHGGPRVHPLRGTVRGRHRSRAGRLWKNGSSRRLRGGRHHVRATRHVLANGVLGAARPMREGPPHGPHAVASA